MYIYCIIVQNEICIILKYEGSAEEDLRWAIESEGSRPVDENDNRQLMENDPKRLYTVQFGT